MKLARILLLVLIAIAIGIGVAIAVGVTVRQRRRLARMSDAELRSFLSAKLAGRVPDEQVAAIQDAVLVKLGRSPSASEIKGTVSYLEPDPIPADAVIIVTVEDTSRQDASSERIGTQVIDQPRKVPVGYSVRFDPADIVDSHSYTVRATITVNDRLLWTTDTHYPVITRGNPLTADLQLIAVQEPVTE